MKLKEDAAAEAVEKEQEQFALDSALQYGRRTYLTTLRASDVKVWNKFFEVDSKKAVMDGEVVPHSLLMHPDVKTFASASFPLGGAARAFRASVGTPKHDPTLGDPASALTFEVIGDGKSLWKSEPVLKVGTFQTCVVKVEKVKTLTLRVHCQGRTRRRTRRLVRPVRRRVMLLPDATKPTASAVGFRVSGRYNTRYSLPHGVPHVRRFFLALRRGIIWPQRRRRP